MTPTPDPTLTPPATRPVPRWHVHRRLYDWVLSLAHHKHSTTALFLLSFAESSFFPIPPDVLQMALTLERRNRAFWYAAVSTAASVLGGIAGWAIGWGLWHLVDDFFFEYVPGFTHANFDFVQSKFAENAFLAVFTAAFTPIPYKVFTIAGGVFGISIPVLVLASILGRGARFFLVATFFWFFGPPAKRLVERYFNVLTIVFTVLLIAGFVLVGRSAAKAGDHGPAGPAQPVETSVPLEGRP
jgi:membrane protein YqaA with SNARE-associated domain